MASMEEEARGLVHGTRRLSPQESVRLRVREIKLRVLRDKVDPLVQEFAETADRLGLPPTRPTGTSAATRPEGADWLLDLPFRYENPTGPQPSLSLAIWRDGRWALRREPEDVHLDSLLHERGLGRLRAALVRELIRVVRPGPGQPST